jgi:phosphoribosylaminoimidazolecarboxamide formyltransferase/IMP cyclohydrolase
VPRALLSVSDKTGLVAFAQQLAAAGWELLSTGGTARTLRDAALTVTDVADVTRFPEMLDGRVKTLHPAVHGALLARRDLDSHMAAIAEHGIAPIDMVVVNLYPFRETAAKPDVQPEDVIEHIDIGGPSMLRSAANRIEFEAQAKNDRGHCDVNAEAQERIDFLDQHPACGEALTESLGDPGYHAEKNHRADADEQ